MYCVFTLVLLFQLLVPSYKFLLNQKDEEMRFKRKQIEHLLHALCQKYASLCGIYSATCGGVQFVPVSEDRVVKHSIDYSTDDIIVAGTPVMPVTDSHKLIKQDQLMCKAHFANANNGAFTFKDKVVFDYDFYEPYTDLMTVLSWCHVGLESLPDDFFARFRQMVYLQLGSSFQKMSRFIKLPKGIGQTEKLRVRGYLTKYYCKNLLYKTTSLLWPHFHKPVGQFYSIL